MRNFACVEVAPQLGRLKVYVKVNPDEVTLEEGFTRDVRGIDHFGTGDLEIMLKSAAAASWPSYARLVGRRPSQTV